jgi:hypothetical protein
LADSLPSHVWSEPARGLLAVEVKGEVLGYDRHEFVYLRTGEKVDPLRQVRRGTHGLARWLKEQGGLRVCSSLETASTSASGVGCVVKNKLRRESACLELSYVATPNNFLVTLQFHKRFFKIL